MTTFKEGVLTAMEPANSEILPYLPHILQDNGEIPPAVYQFKSPITNCSTGSAVG